MTPARLLGTVVGTVIGLVAGALDALMAPPPLIRPVLAVPGPWRPVPDFPMYVPQAWVDENAEWTWLLDGFEEDQ